MNILVTGGAGFIGSHVCARLLESGHAVWVYDDLNDFYDPNLKRGAVRDLQALARPFTFVFGDLTDRPAVDELFASATFDQVISWARSWSWVSSENQTPRPPLGRPQLAVSRYPSVNGAVTSQSPSSTTVQGIHRF